MSALLHKWILDAPRLFIKQYAYAWIFFIALWSIPPNISLVCLFIILAGMFLLRWQHLAWIENIRAKHGGGKFYMDEPPIPWKKSARNIFILVAVTAMVAWFWGARVGISATRFFLIIVGFMLLYRNVTFFGAPTTYIVTNNGVGVYYAPGHLDYRLFIKYNDIAKIERRAFKKDSGWSCLARIKSAEDGLLFTPKGENFTDWIEKMYIAPRDVEAFVGQLPREFTNTLK